MQIWNILGIEATDDAAKIKRAYAAKLKQHHPEDDPEGYQKLREAYDHALKLAKERRKKAAGLSMAESEGQEEDARPSFVETENTRHTDGRNEDEFDPEEIGQDAFGTETESEIETEPEIEPEIETEAETEPDIENEYETTYVHRRLTDFGQNLPPEPADSLERFMERIESLYDHFPSRIDPESWMEQLNSDVMWNVGTQSNVSIQLLYFMEENPFVPEAVWTLLENTFHWSETAGEDPEDFKDEFPNVYAYAVAKPPLLHLGYTALLQAEESVVDDFLWMREKGLLAMLERDYETAKQLLEDASEIFGEDPDAVRLLAACYAQTGDADNALQASDLLVRLQPDEIDGYMYRARAFYERGDLNACLHDLNRVLERHPSYIAALSLAGRCYRMLGEYDNAYEMYKRILDLQPDDIDAVLAVADINRQKLNALESGQAHGGRAERKRLKQALGKKTIGQRLKLGGFFLVTGKWFSLIVLIFLQLYTASSFKNYTGESIIGYFADASKAPEIQTVTSIEELVRLPAKVDGVRFALDQAEYTGIVQVKVTEDDEEEIKYVKGSEIKKQGLESAITGYLCVGELNGKQLIVLTDYDQAKQIYDNHRIELKGTVQDVDPDIVSEYQAWKRQPPEVEAVTTDATGENKVDEIIKKLEKIKERPLNHPLMNPVPEKYVNAVKAPTRSGHVGIPWKFYILFVVIVLLYISIWGEVRRVWRCLRFN
ncbi:tetratricopeptide repeat protein [Paenibacillus sp. VCA1]|uniref:J domain-containing protein n=1 Tax=Paenibacillus sp. VCA1 TaxID=3039148 RepID=UPI002871C5E8|nr:tetratricopeptide repeat protein [Paenibacillus sp. VCA1]MDR9853909.1 tetratricopeptide repeat protein [Paenibacillus sp. VCA1]